MRDTLLDSQLGRLTGRPPQEDQGKALAVVEDKSHKPDPKRENKHTPNDPVGLETQAKQKQNPSE